MPLPFYSTFFSENWLKLKRRIETSALFDQWWLNSHQKKCTNRRCLVQWKWAYVSTQLIMFVENVYIKIHMKSKIFQSKQTKCVRLPHRNISIEKTMWCALTYWNWYRQFKGNGYSINNTAPTHEYHLGTNDDKYQTNYFYLIWFFLALSFVFLCSANSQEIKLKQKKAERTRCLLRLTILPKKNWEYIQPGFLIAIIFKRKFVIDKRMVKFFTQKPNHEWSREKKPKTIQIKYIVNSCGLYLYLEKEEL